MSIAQRARAASDDELRKMHVILVQAMEAASPVRPGYSKVVANKRTVERELRRRGAWAVTAILDGLTPTEYLVLDVMVARYRLGDDSWTFPTTFRPALERLEQRGYLNYKSGVVQHTQHAWLTEEGAKFTKLDQPYMLHGDPIGRCWIDMVDDG